MKLDKVALKVKVGKKWINFYSIPLTSTKRYTKENVTLEVKNVESGHVYFEISSIKPMEEIEYRVSLPLLNFGKVLVPDSGRFYMHKFFPSNMWFQTFNLETRAIGNPFLVLMDLNDKPVLAFGLLGKLIETSFEITSPGVNRKNSLWVKRGRLRFNVKKRTIDPYRFKDGFFLMETADSWWHALREYGVTYQVTRNDHGDLDIEKLKNLENLKKNWKENFKITPRAFCPAFCTWLVINSDKMNHEWVIQMGKKVKELGMEAFILDDGWYGVGLDSFKPGMNIGDWPCSVPGKFKDVSKTLNELKDIGLNPILWFAPLAVGKDSKIFKEVKHLLVKNQGKYYTCPAGFHTLCIRNPAARKVIVDHVERLLKCGAGGLKVDLFDYMSTEPCEADHEHDVETIAEAMELLLKEIQEKVGETDPDALISVTNNHANVHFVVYSSCVRGGDSPYDPNMLILRSIYPAAYTPVVHNDYALWTDYESPKDIAHIMIRQIFAGVPNFTIDFLHTPEKQNEVVKAWLTFFKKVKDLYVHGDFQPLNAHLTVWERVLNGKTLLTVLPPATEIPLIKEFETLYVLNATSRNKIIVGEFIGRQSMEVEVYDFKLSLKDKTVLKELNYIPVEEAGLTIIKRRRS